MDKKIYRPYRRFVSHRLIEAREQAALTQKQVAKTKIISQSSLSKLENGEGRVEFIHLIKLAELYNKPIDFFILKETHIIDSKDNDSNS